MFFQLLQLGMDVPWICSFARSGFTAAFAGSVRVVAYLPTNWRSADSRWSVGKHDYLRV
jgi:hypothetical protein